MHSKKANPTAFPIDAGTVRSGAYLHDNDALRTIIEPGIPHHAESTLTRLYGSFYASLPQLEIEGDTTGVHAYVEERGNKIVQLWLCRLEHRTVRVLNEAITIHADVARRFADAAFAAWPQADSLAFNAVYPELDGLGLPTQRLHGSDDCVLALPASSEAYLAGLGKATRKNMKRYLARFEEAFPGFRYKVYQGPAAPEDLVRTIIGMNRVRMTAKGKVSGIDEEQEARMLQLVRRCGWIGVGSIDGRPCAGAIVYRVGNNHFSFVRAHDPAFNDYRLGLIGAWHLVRACIAQGGHELHFMWGREPHKALLGGVQREQHRVIIYRSRLHALRNADRWMKNAGTDLLRTVKLQLLDHARRGDGRGARLLGQALGVARGIKRRFKD